MLEKGTETPAFTLPNQAGKAVSLSDYDGRVVVVFYPRADTPG